MEAATQVWKTDAIGQWSEPADFTVTRDRIVVYAERPLSVPDDDPSRRASTS